MMSTIEQIAACCRKARIAAGHTQRIVADLVGYHLSTISKFEAGKLNNAVILALYLHLYPDLFNEQNITFMYMEDCIDDQS